MGVWGKVFGTRKKSVGEKSWGILARRISAKLSDEKMEREMRKKECVHRTANKTAKKNCAAPATAPVTTAGSISWLDDFPGGAQVSTTTNKLL